MEGAFYNMVNIEVKRNRASVTQGSADVCINGKSILPFNDPPYMNNGDGTFTNGFDTVSDAKHYGSIIDGWGSIKPDSAFIIGLLYHPYDNIYHYSEWLKKAILEADEKGE